MMTWDIQEIDTLNDLTAPTKDQDCLPQLTIFAEGTGKAIFAITSGKPDTETLTAIQSLHDLYNN